MKKEEVLKIIEEVVSKLYKSQQKDFGTKYEGLPRLERGIAIGIQRLEMELKSRLAELKEK